MHIKSKAWGGVALAFALSVTLVPLAKAAGPAPTTAAGFTQMFADKNDQTWSGGDQMTSYLAGNGKVYWLSGDTLLSDGEDADGSYPDTGTTITSNRILLQNGDELTNAMTNPTGPSVPDPATSTSQNQERYWVQGLFEGNGFFYGLSQRVINSPGGFNVIGTELAKFTADANGLLTFVGMAPTPSTGVSGGQGPAFIQWAGDALVKDGYVYIYGYTLAPPTTPQWVIHNTYLARVPVGLVETPLAWQYYKKSLGLWVVSPALLSTASNSPDSLVGSQVSSVRVIAGKIVMAHKPWNGWGSSVMAEVGNNPWGPFVGKKLFDSPAGTWEGKNYQTYGPMLHPEQTLGGAEAGKILVSIDWNGKSFWTDTLQNADLYKPRFHAVTLP
jgi:hypothetical protein